MVRKLSVGAGMITQIRWSPFWTLIAQYAVVRVPTPGIAGTFPIPVNVVLLAELMTIGNICHSEVQRRHA